MFETIAILVVFFFLLTFGFIFYTKIQKTTYKSEEQEKTILESIQIAERASFLPELQCSFDNVQTEDCIDIYKLESIQGIFNENKDYYYNILGYSLISVEQIYPETKIWNIYDVPKPDYNDKISTQVPISLYNPIKDQHTFGVINIYVYI